MELFNPAHPGEIIKTWLIEDEDGNKISSIAAAARTLGIHRTTLHRLISGSIAVSTEVAVALEDNNCGTAEMWLNMQTKYDLFHYRNSGIAS